MAAPARGRRRDRIEPTRCSAPFDGAAEMHVPNGQQHISEFTHTLLGVEIARRVAGQVAPEPGAARSCRSSTSGPPCLTPSTTRWKPARFGVTVDGEPHEMTGYSVAVGNSGAYGGGMYLLPHALLDDGELDVLMSEDSSNSSSCARCPRCSRALISTRRARTCSAAA